MKHALRLWVISAMAIAVAPTTACHAAPPVGGRQSAPTVIVTPISVPAAADVMPQPASADPATACRTWAATATQSAAERSRGLKTAAEQAASASDRDGRWRRMADEMAFVSSLPETDNTNADIQRAQADQRDISNTCRQLGVVIPN